MKTISATALSCSLILLSLVVFTYSCSNDSSKMSDDELRVFISDSDNGLLKVKSFGGVDFSAKVIPNQLLENVEEQSTVFLITLSPKDEKTALYFAGVNSFEEFKERNKRQYFEMVEYFYLRIGEEIVEPSHCLFEHNYGITPDISFYVQFEDLPSPNEKTKAFNLIYRDVYYAQGVMSFEFDLDNIYRVTKNRDYHG